MTTYSPGFSAAVEHTLKWEGGYENDPRDPGGETNFGIDKRSHPDVDIKNLTREEAIAIYYASYWTPSRAEEMPWPVSAKVFDLAVNTGLHGAGKILQRALGTVTVDGAIGPLTVAAVQRSDPSTLYKALKVQAEAYYRSLSKFLVFGKGWLNRNNDPIPPLATMETEDMEKIKEFILERLKERSTVAALVGALGTAIGLTLPNEAREAVITLIVLAAGAVAVTPGGK